MVVVVVVIPIDVTRIQRCTSIKYTFGWCILGYTPPPRGSRRYTKKSRTPRGGALGDTQRNQGPFFLGLTTLLVFFWSGSTTLLEQSTLLNGQISGAPLAEGL